MNKSVLYAIGWEWRCLEGLKQAKKLADLKVIEGNQSSAIPSRMLEEAIVLKTKWDQEALNVFTFFLDSYFHISKEDRAKYLQEDYRQRIRMEVEKGEAAYIKASGAQPGNENAKKEDPKNTKITIRLTHEEKEEIKDWAGDRSVSSWVMECIRHRIAELKETHKA